MSKIRLLADWVLDWFLLPLWQALFGGGDHAAKAADDEEAQRG